MQGNIERAFIIALLITVVSETITFLLLNALIKMGIRTKHIVVVSTLASSLTLPYVWFVLPVFIRNVFMLHIVSELTVVFIEAYIISELLKIGYFKSMLASLLMNAVSYGLSFFVPL